MMKNIKKRIRKIKRNLPIEFDNQQQQSLKKIDILKEHRFSPDENEKTKYDILSKIK